MVESRLSSPFQGRPSVRYGGFPDWRLSSSGKALVFLVRSRDMNLALLGFLECGPAILGDVGPNPGLTDRKTRRHRLRLDWSVEESGESFAVWLRVPAVSSRRSVSNYRQGRTLGVGRVWSRARFLAARRRVALDRGVLIDP